MNDPWRIERVHLDMTRGQVDVSVGHAKGARFPCPEYGQELAVYEHSAEQPWRQLMTYLHAGLEQILVA